MSPTIFRDRGFRYFFFSLEESRMHVHIRSPDGEAKFWLEPEIELATNKRLSDVQLNQIRKVVEERADELIAAWQDYFPDSGN